MLPQAGTLQDLVDGTSDTFKASLREEFADGFVKMIAQVEDSPPAVGRDVRPNVKAALASSAVPSLPTLAEMIHNRDYAQSTDGNDFSQHLFGSELRVGQVHALHSS